MVLNTFFLSEIRLFFLFQSIKNDTTKIVFVKFYVCSVWEEIHNEFNFYHFHAHDRN